MEARGYIPGAPRTKINLLIYRKGDVVAYVGGFLLLAGQLP
jgi:energy-coupling factor transporter transmembrane protein EcfT